MPARSRHDERGRTAVLVAIATAGMLVTGCGDGVDAPSATGSPRAVEASATPEREAVPPEPDDPEEGRAGFTVDGDTATMSGVIDSGFDDDLRALLAAHPEVDRIVMTFVPGSADDETNLEAARVLHEAGLTTELLPDSVIASGGVDFFLAGTTRIVADGAVVGVHSWASDDGRDGAQVPHDSPEHARYLDYYEEVGVSEDFYWFTLEAAPPDDLHVMTRAELEKFDVATG